MLAGWNLCCGVTIKRRSIFSLDGVEVDIPSRTVTKNGIPVNLTMKEFDLLVLFLQNKNIALFRETLYRRVWGGIIPAKAAQWICTSSDC